MAKLKGCMACGNAVSVEATVCPKCGHPMPKQSAAGRFAGVSIFAVVVAVLVVIGAIVGAISERDVAAQQREDLAKAKKAARQAVERSKVARAAEADACRAKTEELKANYTQLWSQGKYWDAARSIGNCGAATGDAELQKLVALGEVKDRTMTARDPKVPPFDRVRAIEALQRDYPQDVGDLAAILPVLQGKIDAKRESDRKAADAAERAKKRREGVVVGMSKDDVLASSWGKPQKVNTSTYSTHTDEQWVYGGGYLYFRNGVLYAIQN